MRGGFLHLHPTVKEALTDGRPVVALESTVIAHGLPYPRNIETARLMEEAVRKEGAVPATIALSDGKIYVGIEDKLMHRLAQGQETVEKVSVRDLSRILYSGKTGATTVAATMWVAYRAGIRFFATGGIGGVHRGAAETFDISADLEEFSRTPVAVISAGVKSILDIAATLEYLETIGVPVWVSGSDEFPAFYAASSGLAAPVRVDTPEELAAMVRVHFDLDTGRGILIAQPPSSGMAVDRREMNRWIEQALSEAKSRNISGKRLTPFLLQRIAGLSGHKTLEANVNLLIRNARLAARIASAYFGG